MATARPNAAAEEMRKLRPFWRDGRIVQWPARESPRRLVLAELAYWRCKRPVRANEAVVISAECAMGRWTTPPPG